jgi:hypothetical protein
MRAGPIVRVMGEEEVIELTFPALAAYHGQGALAMLALTFQALNGMLALLPAMPRREEIAVLSGHPGPGVRDAFEFATRAVTRGAYTVDRSLPDARFNPHGPMSYSFRLTVGDRTVSAVLREGVLPPRFFALFKGGDPAELSALKRQIAAAALAATPDRLFVLS